jgi:imidazolonepropionase-like amidohydrolase
MRTVIVLLLLSALPALAQAQQRAASKTLVLTYVTVIDATGAPAQPDMTVVISGERITALEPAGKITPARDAQVINAKGRFLIPGLWDMHVHTSWRNFPALFLANGITGVRDMGGAPDEFERLTRWRAELKRDALPAPHIVSAGIVVDGPAGKGRPDSLHVANEREAQQAVISLRNRGADFIKVYSLLARDAYFAIADEAKKQRLPFAGHVPAAISAAEASDAGQKSMEHLFGVLSGCAKNEAELLRVARAEIANSHTPVFIRAELHAQVQALDTWDEFHTAALLARFARNNTWQVPTLIGFQNLSNATADPFGNDARLKFIAAERKEAWKKQRAYLLQHLTTAYWDRSKKLFQKQLELVGAMQRAGVGLLAGTDTAGFYVFPGFSLHDELELLEQAGLTPMEALQTATRNPAWYLGMSETLGTIEKGKRADLVLLEANPLETISNTRKIAAVIPGGRLIARQELDRLLAEAEVAAGQQ